MSTRPTQLKFFLDPNDDEDLSCNFCQGPKCEQSFSFTGAGQKRTVGVHNKCAEEHAEKQKVNHES